MDNGVRWLIHRIGTPRLQISNRGGIEPAGEWWQGTGWGDASNAEPVIRLNGSILPKGGEWVEVYWAI
jgi:hypothetical protein